MVHRQITPKCFPALTKINTDGGSLFYLFKGDDRRLNTLSVWELLGRRGTTSSKAGCRMASKSSRERLFGLGLRVTFQWVQAGRFGITGQ
jgi:hypothetical protein